MMFPRFPLSPRSRAVGPARWRDSESEVRPAPPLKSVGATRRDRAYLPHNSGGVRFDRSIYSQRSVIARRKLSSNHSWEGAWKSSDSIGVSQMFSGQNFQTN